MKENLDVLFDNVNKITLERIPNSLNFKGVIEVQESGCKTIYNLKIIQPSLDSIVEIKTKTNTTNLLKDGILKSIESILKINFAGTLLAYKEEEESPYLFSITQVI